jgi:hypothetical protein
VPNSIRRRRKLVSTAVVFTGLGLTTGLFGVGVANAEPPPPPPPPGQCAPNVPCQPPPPPPPPPR